MSVDSSHKVVMLGNSGVGKTSIVLQLKEKVFKRMVTPTVGSGVNVKEIQTSKGIIPLKIWDTAGEERYRSFTGLYSQDAIAAIIVFDVTEQSTFDSINEWVAEFRKNALANAIIYLAGNKTDLLDQREISFDQANEFAQNNSMKYFEVSAKTGENVELLFQELATQLGPKHQVHNEPQNLTPSSQGQEKSCC
ncbi:small GTP-binding protein [Tritrichomonas foetus]|uniref:Small GTP-binding protein n=1 Tax=Tritrichomonas foetus TaxID=1144522 RepID=A0A1J4KQK6_9EUKA|nr:small GTP-binding protein [Tritrichomonas foetus]|eukprot:OHT11725.1 small GTP-binding protein [Tritrichomonas foetus]